MKKTVAAIFSFIVLLLMLTNCFKNADIPEPNYLPNLLTEYNADHDAFLSPDGQKIAFQSLRNTYDPYNSGYNFELWLMDRDGANQRLLFGSTNSNNYRNIEIIKWTEDSKYIIVSASLKDANTQHDMLKISLTGTKTLLFPSTFSPKDISYSSDGKKVAFLMNGLHIANSDFSEITRVDTSISSYCWTNSSETLVYLKHQLVNKKFEDDIWKYDLKNNQRSKITSDRQRKVNLKCSVSNNLLFLRNDSLFVSSMNNFLPRFIMDGVFSIRNQLNWVNKRDLILLRKQQSDNEFNWSESWVIDTDGNIIKKIAPGANSIVHFSDDGHYYLYTIMGFGTWGGSIWLDFLP